MKGSCTTLVASAMAASTVAAFTSSASAHRDANIPPDEGKSGKSRGGASGKQKYAPRFDGLRFIETLVTAHR